MSFPIILPDTAQKLRAEQKKILVQANFLQASSKVKKNSKIRRVILNEFPESSIAVDLECVFTKVGASFFEISELPSREVERWLIVSSMGDGESLEFAKSDPSLLPSGGVAVQLLLTEFNTFLPKPKENGTVFCYLPLPIHSGLPVFINGAFAVDSNRRRLQGKLEDDKRCYGEEWNNVLMTDAISTTYLCLLEYLKKILPGDGEASSLFLPADGRFPYGDGNTFFQPHVLAKLGSFGIKSNDLPWRDVAERAESVQHVNAVDSKAAVMRSKVLLKFTGMKLKRKAKFSSDAFVSHLQSRVPFSFVKTTVIPPSPGRARNIEDFKGSWRHQRTSFFRMRGTL